MIEKIKTAIEDGIQAIEQLKEQKNILFIEESAKLIATCFNHENKVIIAGNGGSLCDAAHFAEELTGYFRQKRPALPAISLTEPGHLTCVGNDVGFDHIFSRGVEAFGKPGDVFIGLSTSGKSPNIIKAFQKAQEMELNTISFLGKDGGHLKGFADLELLIHGFKTSDRIQEAHMAALHIIVEQIEYLLFPEEVRNKALPDLEFVKS